MTTTSHPSSSSAALMPLLLPGDILGRVFQYISLKDLGQCAQICRVWNHFLFHDDFTWRCKMEDIGWCIQSLGNSNTSHDTTIANYDNGGCSVSRRTIFRDWILEKSQLANALERGNFMGDCDTKPWLLFGHSKTVRSILEMTSMDGNCNYIVTISDDGEIQYWKLPFESSRPKGKTVPFNLKDRVGTISTAVTTISRDLNSTANVAAIGFKGAIIVQLYWKKEDKGNEDYSLHCRALQNLSGHQGPVRCICDVGSHTLITGCSDGILRVFKLPQKNDLDNGLLVEETGEAQAILQMKGHRSGVNTVSLGCDNNTVLSHGSDQTVRLWNYETGGCLWVFHFDKAVAGTEVIGIRQKEMALFCDSLEQPSMRIMRIPDGKLKKEIKPSSCTLGNSRVCVTCIYDRFLLCGTEDGSLLQFNVDTGEQTHFLDRILRSSVLDLEYLLHDTVLATGEDGHMVVVKILDRVDSVRKAKVKVLRDIALNMRPQRGGLFYSPESSTILVPSSGYLVRAFAFSS